MNQSQEERLRLLHQRADKLTHQTEQIKRKADLLDKEIKGQTETLKELQDDKSQTSKHKPSKSIKM